MKLKSDKYLTLKEKQRILRFNSSECIICDERLKLGKSNMYGKIKFLPDNHTNYDIYKNKRLTPNLNVIQDWFPCCEKCVEVYHEQSQYAITVETIVEVRFGRKAKDNTFILRSIRDRSILLL